MVILKSDYTKRGVHIDPFRNDVKEYVTYDLHVADEFQRPGTTTREPMPEEYTLQPRQCIVVLTEESLTLPKNVFGVLCARGGLALRGLTIPNTKVDPNFTGKLRIAVFNSGDTPIGIRTGQAICSIYFLQLEHDIEGNEHPAAPEITAQRISLVAGFFRLFGVHPRVALGVTALSALSGYLGAAYYVHQQSTGNILGALYAAIKPHVTTIVAFVSGAVLSGISAYSSTRAALRKGRDKHNPGI